ncbi:MAG: hypothetical protein U9N14_03285 [Pseudomonadota bacterium]|nr:hypothetical protein [Pseudomonadota bacterium]
MFSVSATEILIVLIAVLVFIRPEDMPRAMYRLGRVVRPIRKAWTEMRDAFDDAMDDAEIEDIRAHTDDAPGESGHD